MPVEAATYIGDFDLSSPRDNELVREGDNHIRDVLKKAIVQTFPGAGKKGFAKEITATEDEINHLDGVTDNIQEQFKAITNTYVEVDGGKQSINGQLSIKGELTIEGVGSDEYVGVALYNSTGGLKGSIDLHTIDNHVQIQQTGPVENAIIDTIMEIFDGNIEMVPGSGISALPTLDNHLTVKKYVDDNFVSSTAIGEVQMAGILVVHEGLKVIADTGNTFDGMVVAFNGVNRAGFAFNETVGTVLVIQNDASGVNETVLTLNEGKARITTGNGSDLTPQEPTDLATKKYVDDNIQSGGATQSWVTDNFIANDDGDQYIEGELTVVQAVRVNATGTDDFDGFVVNHNGANRAGFVYEESTGIVEVVQNNSFGDNVTVLALNNGAITVNGAPVALGAVNATSAGASGSFEDNNGNTVTVVNGLITSLS